MNNFEKMMSVMARNIEYTIILLISFALFAIFSDGLFAGLITAASALIAYICVDKLYKEFKKKSGSKK
jgi:hypothetical protein